MKQLFFKLISLPVLIYLGYLAFNLSTVQISESIFILDPYIDTDFAPHFTIKNLKKVSIGMSKSKVDALLGEPLSVSESSNCIVNYYTSDAAFRKSPNYSRAKVRDFAWYNVTIKLNSNQRVVDINTHWAYD